MSVKKLDFSNNTKKRNLQMVVAAEHANVYSDVQAIGDADVVLSNGTFEGDVMWITEDGIPFGPRMQLLTGKDLLDFTDAAPIPRMFFPLSESIVYKVVGKVPEPQKTVLEIFKGPPKRNLTMLVTSGENSLFPEIEALMRAFYGPRLIPIVRQEHLDCGDVAWILDNNPAKQAEFIIERKNNSDFVSSIMDKRNKSQSTVMSEQGVDAANIMYIVERDPLAVYSKLNPKAIVGSLVYPLLNGKSKRLALVDSVRATAALCVNFHMQMEYCDEDKLHAQKIVFGNILNGNVKKSDIAECDIMIGLLTRITGVSDAIAEAVRSRYPTFADLMIAYKNTPAWELDTMLQDIPVTRIKGTTRIGPFLSKKIASVFCPREIFDKTEVNPKSKKRNHVSDEDD